MVVRTSGKESGMDSIEKEQMEDEESTTEILEHMVRNLGRMLEILGRPCVHPDPLAVDRPKQTEEGFEVRQQETSNSEERIVHGIEESTMEAHQSEGMFVDEKQGEIKKFNQEQSVNAKQEEAMSKDVESEMKLRRGTRAKCKGRKRKSEKNGETIKVLAIRREQRNDKKNRLNAKKGCRELVRTVQEVTGIHSIRGRETERRLRQGKIIRLKRKKKKQIRKKRGRRSTNQTLSSPSVNQKRIHSSLSVSGASHSKKHSWRTFSVDRSGWKRRFAKIKAWVDLRLGVKIPKLPKSSNSSPTSDGGQQASVIIESKSISMHSSPSRGLKSGISETLPYSLILRPLFSRIVSGAGTWRRGTSMAFNFSKEDIKRVLILFGVGDVQDLLKAANMIKERNSYGCLKLGISSTGDLGPNSSGVNRAVELTVNSKTPWLANSSGRIHQATSGSSLRPSFQSHSPSLLSSAYSNRYQSVFLKLLRRRSERLCYEFSRFGVPVGSGGTFCGQLCEKVNRQEVTNTTLGRSVREFGRLCASVLLDFVALLNWLELLLLL